MRKPNIIWILCDSVRIYKTDQDERGRLDAMDVFAEEAVDFRTAITAAPSTVMSISSMITSIPSPFQSLSYNDFSYLGDQISSFPQILRQNDYNTHGLFFWPDGRNFLGPIYGDTCNELWADLNPDDFWTNDDQIALFKRFIDSEKSKKPFFTWLHLNCRGDAALSDKLLDLITYLKEKNFWDDDIIIINSDHGYPDESRGISYYDKRKYGHDLIMSDDNILAPQLIKFPTKEKATIQQPISTLDMGPTILDYLGYLDQWDLSSFMGHGISVLPMLQGKKEWSTRKIRVDNRFLFQPNMVTSLRDDRYKYTIYVDEQREEFFDIVEDKLEVHNKIKDPEYASIIMDFQDYYNQQTQEVIDFHSRRIASKICDMIKSIDNVAICGIRTKYFDSVFKKAFKLLGIDLIVNPIKETAKSNDRWILSSKTISKNCEVLVFPVSKYHDKNDSMIKSAKKMTSSDKITYLDYNLNTIKPPQSVWSKALGKPKQYYRRFKYDPKTTILTILVDIRRGFSLLRNR